MDSGSIEPSWTDSRSLVIGREREISEVASSLTHTQAALVTITGPGGIGKTRLAYRVADEVTDAFPGGVRIVSLSAIQDAADVLPALIRAFDVRAGADATDLRRIEASLGGRRTLLLIDNFEHLTGEAPLVSMMLSAAPSLTTLVTSRAALRLSAEREFPLGPLSLPSRRLDITASEALGSSAVAPVRPPSAGRAARFPTHRRKRRACGRDRRPPGWHSAGDRARGGALQSDGAAGAAGAALEPPLLADWRRARPA